MQSRRTALRAFIGGIVAMSQHATSANGIELLVYDAANRYGVRGDVLWSIALCESNGNPDALSRRLNINGTHDVGLFQINELTWDWWSSERGINADIWDPYANADMAAWAWANGYACHWVCAYSIGWCS